MKNNWLRGLLLGVSMALLLSGGVALAEGPVRGEGVSALGEYEDFGDGWSNHWTDEDNADGPDATSADYDMGLDDPGPPPKYFCVNRYDENTPIDFVVFVSDLGVDEPYHTYAWFYTCGYGGAWGTVEWVKIWYDTDADDVYDDTNHELGTLYYDPDPDNPRCGLRYAPIPNNWVSVGDRGNLFEISLTYPADDSYCVQVREGGLYMEEEVEEVEEFVPEPASIMLLGSGLAGLAGYATLRWRTRE